MQGNWELHIVVVMTEGSSAVGYWMQEAEGRPVAVHLPCPCPCPPLIPRSCARNCPAAQRGTGCVPGRGWWWRNRC